MIRALKRHVQLDTRIDIHFPTPLGPLRPDPRVPIRGNVLGNVWAVETVDGREAARGELKDRNHRVFDRL